MDARSPFFGVITLGSETCGRQTVPGYGLSVIGRLVDLEHGNHRERVSFEKAGPRERSHQQEGCTLTELGHRIRRQGLPSSGSIGLLRTDSPGTLGRRIRRQGLPELGNTGSLLYGPDGGAGTQYKETYRLT